MEANSTTPPSDPNAGKALGIAGMILGIVAILVSFIPCFGWWAVVLAVVGIVLSTVSLNQAKRAGAPKGMAITGLICSILAIVIVTIYISLFATAIASGVKELEKTGALDSLAKGLKQISDSVSTHIKEIEDTTGTR